MFVKWNTKLVMVLLLVFALFASGLQASPASAATQIGTGSVSVDGSQQTGTLLAETPVTYEQNETALDALMKAANNNVDVIDDPTYGKYINGIMGLSAEGTNYWAFYINGIASQLGADSYIVHDGDKLSFRYEDYTQPSNSVSLKIIGNNSQVLHDYSGYSTIGITGHPTALQLLQVTLGQDKVGIKDTSYGPMITSIDGTEAQGNSYWAFYVNGQYASVGADSYQLQPNDQISFKYETFTPPSGGSTDSSGNTSTGGTSNPGNADAISADKLQKSIDTASQYILNGGADDWGAIALKRAGKTVPASYLQNVMTNIQNKGGNFHNITDAERYTLGILAAGGDPTNSAGYNLVQSIYNGDVTKQGLNGVIYALIAVDSGNFTVPASATWTRDKLVKEILDNQHSDGGWSLNITTGSGAIGDLSDPDITSMALTALAPYKDQADVKAKIDLGIQYLAKTYQASTVNSSTTAQILIALTSLGTYETSSQLFEKNGVSLISYLLSFQNNDGGFALNSGEASDLMATQQGLMALDAYQLNGKEILFKFPDPASAPVGITLKSAAAVTAQAAGDSQAGKSLPNTATDSANLLLAGLLLLMSGMVFTYLNRKRKA